MIIWQMIKSFAIFFRSSWQVTYGTWRVLRLPQPIITIFGGSRAQENDEYSHHAYVLARDLASKGFSIVSGGGPGVMKAVGCGAADATTPRGTHTLGIRVHGIDETFKNTCAPIVHVSNFFTRKWLLMRYSAGFIVFPGGIGTVNEFFEVLNELKHKRYGPAPVVLINSTYWQGLLTWFRGEALEHDFVTQDYVKFIVVTDSLEEAVQLVTAKQQPPKDA